MGVVLITPADEMPQLTGVAIDGLLAASAAALLKERFSSNSSPKRTAPASAATKRRETKANASALSMPLRTGGILATVLATRPF